MYFQMLAFNPQRLHTKDNFRAAQAINQGHGRRGKIHTQRITKNQQLKIKEIGAHSPRQADAAQYAKEAGISTTRNPTAGGMPTVVIH